MNIVLKPRIILGIKNGYYAEVNGSTYNVVKNPGGGWKIMEFHGGGSVPRKLPSVRTLDDAKESIASNEGLDYRKRNPTLTANKKRSIAKPRNEHSYRGHTIHVDISVNPGYWGRYRVGPLTAGKYFTRLSEAKSYIDSLTDEKRKENPAMATTKKRTTKKPSAAQLAARAKFAAAAKARANKKGESGNTLGLTAREVKYRDKLIAEGKWRNPSAETVREAYAAHLRLVAKRAARKSNPSEIHIDIGSHNTKGRNVRAKNPRKSNPVEQIRIKVFYAREWRWFCDWHQQAALLSTEKKEAAIFPTMKDATAEAKKILTKYANSSHHGDEIKVAIVGGK